MKTLLVFLVSAFVFGCATDPIPPFEANFSDQRFLYQEKGDDTVPVTVVRDKGFFGAGCSAKLFINNQLAAYLRPSEKVVLHLRPGEYVLGSDMRTEGLCFASNVVGLGIIVKSDQPQHYRIGIDQGGNLGLFRAMDW